MPGYLLSDHVGFVVRLDFEAAVVGPEIDGDADASDTALVDLPRVSPIFVYTGDVGSPSLPPRSRQSQTPSRHISSRSRRTKGILRGSGRRPRAWMRLLAGWSCG
jgi:hypothetical protein